MRLLHIFLIMNIVICSGEICKSAIVSQAADSEAVESCHKMDQHTSSQEISKLLQDYNENKDYEMTCCNDLINSSVFVQNIKIYAAKTIEYHLNNNFLSKQIVTHFNHLTNGHDPPDLHILNSTFLI